MTFGQIVADARKKACLSQKDLAARITKEDGTPISPQYLNDIERDRRNPPSEYLIGQFARVLGIPENYLYYMVDQLPPTMRDRNRPPEDVERAFVAFRGEMKKRT